MTLVSSQTTHDLFIDHKVIIHIHTGTHSAVVHLFLRGWHKCYAVIHAIPWCVIGQHVHDRLPSPVVGGSPKYYNAEERGDAGF